jgi:predicted nucleotidyltransferase
MIFSVGTQVVVQKDTYHPNRRVAHPAGSVGTIVRSPLDRNHSYRVKFNDDFEAAVHHDQLIRLSEFKRIPRVAEVVGDPSTAPALRSGEGALTSSTTSDSREGALTGSTTMDLRDRIIYRCVIGSRAYGLEDDNSDTDRRGIYLPPAELHWSLYGVPEQLENDETQEAYWEIQKFIVLALKANPNVLECLYSPLVEFATPLAQELLSMREAFLSKLVFQTYSGYVASQFKKMQTDIQNQGRVKWKHVMHLIRLLISGIDVLREGKVTVDVGTARDQLLAIKRGQVTFSDADAWRKSLQVEFEQAFKQTALPDRPDYERANAFLIRARIFAMQKNLP